MHVILQDCPHSMFLFVVATKIVTHFNDNVTGLKIDTQETKKSKSWILLMAQKFFRWHQLLCQTQAHFHTTLGGFQFINKFFKKPNHYPLLRDFGEVSFIYLFVSHHWELNTCMISIYILSGLWEETWWRGNPVEKSLKNSLTKVHLSVIVLGVRM